MVRRFLAISFLLFSCFGHSIKAQVVVLVGVSNGQDLFVQNPYDVDQKKFCITGVRINGVTQSLDLNSSALMVDLASREIGSDVRIEISHIEGCEPNVLNPRVINKNAGFRFIQTMADQQSVSWLTTGESPNAGTITLQKLKLDGWKDLKIVPSKGDMQSNAYSQAVAHYSGDNQFRLIYEVDGKEFISDTFSFYSAQDPISYYPVEEVDQFLQLSRTTDYQIKDLDGNLIMQGVGLDINVSSLPYGEYYLIIENRQETFYKPVPEKD